MQKLVLLPLLLLAAVVLSQEPGPHPTDFVIDSIHGFRVEYDDISDIILFVSRTDCYIIEAEDNTWDQVVTNNEELHTITDEIYAQILAERGIVSLTPNEAIDLYDSNLEQWQCRGKNIHRVRYIPAV